MSEITRSPLCWPDAVPRTPPHRRTRPLFTEKTIFAATDFLLAEIDRLSCRPGYTVRKHVVISSNLRLRNDGAPISEQKEPADTGIAVYFPLIIRRGDKELERPIVLTCDRWIKTAWNIYAIAKDIEAQRGRDRWGCTNIEQAFRGYLALPARCGGKPWWEILGVPHTITRQDDVESAFRLKALKAHPDKGGDPEQWAKLQEAREQGLAATS